MPARSAEARKVRGEFFTPPSLVSAVLALARTHLPREPLSVVDPACGDGAFLAESARELPGATLHGLEIDPGHAATACRRVPRAKILTGDAFRGGWETLLASLPPDRFELWLGNPPYNGTSPLLRDAPAYRALRARVGLEVPPGTSL
ncbi:MAG TPA: N-6 DNA methylase, partial [Myxococcaceae bacterium]|nr:N-6 DNA methylase [Myxococcaceae bacterium]